MLNAESKDGDIWEGVAEHYQVLKAKGQGAFGTVVKAKHRRTGKDVAIKLIQYDASNYYFLKKILREMSILR